MSIKLQDMSDDYLYPTIGRKLVYRQSGLHWHRTNKVLAATCCALQLAVPNSCCRYLLWEISAGRSPVLVSTHGDFELFQSVVRGRLTRKKLGEAVEMYRDIINEIEGVAMDEEVRLPGSVLHQARRRVNNSTGKLSQSQH